MNGPTPRPSNPLTTLACVLVAATLFVGCGGGGRGGGSSALLTADQAAQMATANGITQDPTKGTVVVDASQVSSSSIHASAVVGSLTVEIYASGSPVGSDAVVEGDLVVFFNVSPGTIEVRVTRGGERSIARPTRSVPARWWTYTLWTNRLVTEAAAPAMAVAEMVAAATAGEMAGRAMAVEAAEATAGESSFRRPARPPAVFREMMATYSEAPLGPVRALRTTGMEPSPTT